MPRMPKVKIAGPAMKSVNAPTAEVKGRPPPRPPPSLPGTWSLNVDASTCGTSMLPGVALGLIAHPVTAPIPAMARTASAAIFGVRPFAAEGRSPWGDGRPALAGREGSRRGGTPLRRARSRAQGAALVKNKVYKYWFKSRLKDRLAVAEKRAETLANAGFSACGQPLKCQ